MALKARASTPSSSWPPIGNRLAERARRDGGRRLRQPSHRARDPERDHRGAPPGPGPRRRPARRRCRSTSAAPAARPRSGRRTTRAYVASCSCSRCASTLLGHAPSGRLVRGASIGPRARALLGGDGGAVPLEGRRVAAARCIFSPSVWTSAWRRVEIVAHALGATRASSVGIAAIAQHHEARLQARQRQHRVAHARAQAQGGQRLRGDLPIHRHQPADRAQTDDAHRREHDDDQGEPQEDLRRESHAVCLPLTDPAGRRRRSPPGTAGARVPRFGFPIKFRAAAATAGPLRPGSRTAWRAQRSRAAHADLV